VKYGTIVADPPWEYEGFATDPTSGRYIPASRSRPVASTPLPYASMTVAEIEGLPVADMAARDARLFLWTTSRYLPDSFSIARAWGFTYRQTLTWRKTGNPSPFGGSLAPNHAEFMIVATTGKPPRRCRLPSSVIDAPAANNGAHSRKPELFLDLVEQVSPGPYLELFARRQRLGWDTWGNEALCHVTFNQRSMP